MSKKTLSHAVKQTLGTLALLAYGTPQNGDIKLWNAGDEYNIGEQLFLGEFSPTGANAGVGVLLVFFKAHMFNFRIFDLKRSVS